MHCECQRLAKILHDADVSFGLLFDGERNAGNDVRQVGEQGLFEMLVEHNMNDPRRRAVRGDSRNKSVLSGLGYLLLGQDGTMF